MRRLMFLLPVACVPLATIDGAPCPCPEGFQCCLTLAECIPEGDTCPDTYPPSSQDECSRDADCQRGEACQAWAINSETVGPKTCRRSCAGGLPCAEGEACRLAGHDGRALNEVQVAPLCVATEPPAGCSSSDCEVCGEELLGRTYCDETRLRGCFLSLHPVCGVQCEDVLIGDCGSSECVGEPGLARCEAITDGDPCYQEACRACDGVVAPQEHVCNGDELLSCLTLPIAPYPCDEVCALATQTCDGGCVTDACVD